MAIHQSKHQSDLEKRLKILRQQFYGREEKTQKNIHSTNYQLPTTDISYLHQDLTKIFLLAGAALTLQIILYFLLKNNILNINLF